MDRDLLRQCLTYHGDSLFSTLKCEQIENPDFQAIVSDLSKATYERRNAEEGSCLVEQFISRKADILFCPTWKTATPEQLDHEVEEASDPCAIMPPLELFMEVSYEERRAMLYRDLERGDAVVGRINNIREYGFFLTLLCMAGGLERDIEDLEVSALCHIKEIPSTGNHDDPLSYYQIGDLIRASVKDIDRYQEKITASLHPSSLSPSTAHIKLGVIAREELPRHYSRSLRASSDTSETYERLLRGGHGYHNPSVVDYLLGKVGISETQPPSLMRGLQSKHFQQEDFASVIRKKQSASWALKCVRAGVDHFKHGRHVDAMNEYNKALEIDTNNVEALVARGALYANKGSITKAIADFELGLENCPEHRNAKKYLCQTLVERGKQLQEQEKLVTAEGLYRRALSLDETYPEAQDALRKITDTIQKSIRLREEALAKEQEKAKSETSAEKLRKILKEEKRMKRKGKRTSSFSSSTSSTSTCGRSSDSDASSRRRSKKRRKKGRRSSRRSKRHRRLSSKDDRRSSEGKRSRGCAEAREEEGEWYPEPPNTSATFLGRRGGPGWGEGPEEDEDDRRISQLYSLSAASEDEAPDKEQRRGGQEEWSREREAGRRRSRDNMSTEREAGRRWSRDDRSTEREAGRRWSRDNMSTEREAGRRRSRDDRSTEREAGRRRSRDNRDKSSSRETGRSCRDDGDRSRSREAGRSCRDDGDRCREAGRSCRDDGDRSREAGRSCRDDGDRSRETGKKVNGGDRRVSGASSMSLDRRSQGELSSSSSSSSSSAEAEYCRKSHPASGKPDGDRKSADPSSSMRSTLDGSRYEDRGLQESREKEGATVKEAGRPEGGSGALGATGAAARNGRSGVATAPPGGGPKKDLPTNLLDIFNQIAQFEKEKGVRPKK